MKKVLIITYYWPPSGGAGVQRWVRFVKHLREFGWEPTIYTAENPQYLITDEKLLAEIPKDVRVLKHKIIEPNNLISAFSLFKKDKKNVLYNIQSQKGAKRNFIQKAVWFIRGNFFIPDARFLWIKPSIKYLAKVLEKEHFDLLVSTGPPHSLNLIGKGLKKKLNIPWVADFRDPWTTMDYLAEMFLTSFAKKKHKRLEKSVINTADEVLVVGRSMYEEYKKNYNRESKIIYNGYQAVREVDVKIELNQKFTILHLGSFLKNRNCNDLWEVLAELTSENDDFARDLEIRLVGKVASTVIDSILENELKEYLNLIDYVAFSETSKYLRSAQVLLLPIDRIYNAEFVLTGKLFEYLQAKRPILLIGPSYGDAAQVINDCQAGYCCDFDAKDQIKKHLLTLYTKYQKGENYINSINVDQYSGYEITKKLVAVFDNLITKK